MSSAAEQTCSFLIPPKSENPMFLHKVPGLLEQEDAFHDCFHSGRFYTPSGLCVETEAGWLSFFSSWSEKMPPQRRPLPYLGGPSLTSIVLIYSLETRPKKQLLRPAGSVGS